MRKLNTPFLKLFSQVSSFEMLNNFVAILKNEADKKKNFKFYLFGADHEHIGHDAQFIWVLLESVNKLLSQELIKLLILR